jgi:hypothetical protein
MGKDTKDAYLLRSARYTELEADLVVSLALSVGDLKRLKYSGPREKVGSAFTPEN